MHYREEEWKSAETRTAGRMKGQPGSRPEVLAKTETLTEHHLRLKAETRKKRWLLEEGSSNTQTLTRNSLITTLVGETMWRPEARNDTEVLVNWWRESATGAAAPPKTDARLAHPNLVLRKKQKTQKQAQPLTTMTTQRAVMKQEDAVQKVRRRQMICCGNH